MEHKSIVIEYGVENSENFEEELLEFMSKQFTDKNIKITSTSIKKDSKHQKALDKITGNYHFWERQ